MFGREDNTFREIQERSFFNWLEEMAEHDDVAVRGGVRLAEEYVESLKKQIEMLKEQGRLKDEYLKKMKAKQKEI